MGGCCGALGKSESKIALDGVCTEPVVRSHVNKCSICFGVGVNSETPNSTTTKVLFFWKRQLINDPLSCFKLRNKSCVYLQYATQCFEIWLYNDELAESSKLRQVPITRTLTIYVFGFWGVGQGCCEVYKTVINSNYRAVQQVSWSYSSCLN